METRFWYYSQTQQVMAVQNFVLSVETYLSMNIVCSVLFDYIGLC